MHIYFHIGAGKTGSSAIQHALATNQVALESQGFYLPSEDLTVNGKVTGYHVWWFEKIKQMDMAEALIELNRGIDCAVSAALEKNCDKIVFSAENLSNVFSWHGLLHEAIREHESSVVIYVRRQDDYLLSAWQQWGLKTGASFYEWLLRNIGVAGDWRVPIEEWQSIATHKILVRVYQRDRLINKDVVDDFYDALAIDANEFSKSKGNINTSYNTAVEELALSAPGLFEGPHDNQFFNMIQKYGQLAHKKVKGESRLTGAERRSIIERYQSSNEWIKSKYFEGLDGPLFPMPVNDDYHVPSPNEVDANKWALITEMVYGMHKHIHNK